MKDLKAEIIFAIICILLFVVSGICSIKKPVEKKDVKDSVIIEEVQFDYTQRIIDNLLLQIEYRDSILNSKGIYVRDEEVLKEFMNKRYEN